MTAVAAVAFDHLELLDDRHSTSLSRATTLPENATLSGLAGTPEWLTAVEARINYLLNLLPNWDGYGAKPIDPRRAQLALDLLSAVMTEKVPVPAIVPGSDGGVQLEWHCGQVDLEVETLSPHKLGVLFEDLATDEEWEREIYDFRPIAEALQLIVQREAAGR